MSDIDLPTLVQRIRVDTSGLDRAERVARAFGGKLDDELGTAGGAAESFAQKADNAAASTHDLGAAADDAGGHVKDLGTDSHRAADGTDRLNASISNTGGSATGAAAAIERLGDRTRRTTEATKASVAASSDAGAVNDKLRLARLRLAVATNDVESAEGKLAAARDSGKTEEVVRGESRLAEAMLRQASAHNEVTRAQARNDSSHQASALRDLTHAAEKAGNATSFLGRMMTSLKVPGIVAAITTATGALAALGAGAVALIGQLGPLIGVLGSLPAAIGALGSIKGVFSGLVKGPAAAAAAVTKAQEATTSAARATKDAQEAVAEASKRATDTQVRGARDVADSQQQVKDTVERSADAVIAAEDNLARAQRASTQAQKDLTQARDDAREKLQDLALELRGAALDEEAGGIALAKARERLDQARTSGNPRELQEADLAYRQAILRLDQIKERNDDLRTSATKAAKEGIKGNQQVVAAQQNVVDTQAAQKQAAADLERTQRDSARAVVRANRDLADTMKATADANIAAQKAVQKAQEDASAAAVGGSKAASDAMKDLGPEAQAFAKQLIAVKGEFADMKKEGQRIALPGLTAGLISAKALLPSIRSGYAGVAAVIGQTGKSLGGLAASGPFAAKFGAVVASNTRIVGMLGKAVTPLVEALINVAYAARGMSERFAAAFGSGAEKVRDFTSNSARLEKFFKRTGDLVFQLARTFRDFGIGLKNVFGIGARESVQFTDLLEKGAAKFRAFTESAGGQNKIAKFFRDTKPALEEMGRLVRDVLKLFGHFATDKNLAPLLKQIRTEMLPAMKRLGDAVSKNVAPTIVKLATAFLEFQSVLSFSPIFAVADGIAELVIGVSKLIGAVPGLSTVVATLLAFNIALKGVAVAGKVTGLTGIAKSFQGIGPAGSAGAKGLGGFIQGLKGVDKAANAAAGRSQSLSNILGGAFRSLPAKAKSLGSTIASGIGKGVSASTSVVTSIGRTVASAGAAVGKAGVRVGTATGSAISRGITASASGVSRAMSGIGGAVTKLGLVLTAARGGFMAAAAGAKAFTIALLTNPIFLIIAAIVALVAGIVLLYKHSETFRAIVSAAWAGVQKAVEVAVNLIVGYVKYLVSFWTSVIKGGIAVLQGIFRAGWTLIVGIVKAAVALFLAPIKAQFELIKLAVTTALKVIKALFKGDFDKIPGILGDALKGVWTIFRNLGGDVLNAIGDLGKTLFNAGKQLIQGLIDGIKDSPDLVKNAVKGVLGPVGYLLPGSPIKDGPLKHWNGGTPGKRLMELVASGVRDGGPRVTAAMGDALKDLDGAVVGGKASFTPRVTIPQVAIPQPPVPALAGARAGTTAGVAGTVDNRRYYDVDVHETNGPTTASSLTRRLRALDTYGHAALSGRTAP